MSEKHEAVWSRYVAFALLAEQRAKTEDTGSTQKALTTKMTKPQRVPTMGTALRMAGTRQSSVSEVLLVGWMIWQPIFMQSHCSRVAREAGCHYCEVCGQVPEYLLFNFISNLFTPAMMWRSLSSSHIIIDPQFFFLTREGHATQKTTLDPSEFLLEVTLCNNIKTAWTALEESRYKMWPKVWTG